MPGFDKRFGGFVRRSGIEMLMGAEDNRGEVDPALVFAWRSAA